MEALTGSTKIIFLGFFVSHILPTVLMDAANSYLPLPTPAALKDLSNSYAVTFNDPHFLTIEPWFMAYMTIEIMTQLPYFFVAIYMLLDRPTRYPEWFRIWSIVYGVSTATTLVSILYNHIRYDDSTWSQRGLLLSLYLPYMLLPLWIAMLATQPDLLPCSRPMKAFSGSTRTAMYWFFLLHIPTTIFVDAQGVLPHSVYPQPLLDLVQWYVRAFGDDMMDGPPFEPWFQACIFCETTLQISFIVMFYNRLSRTTSTTTTWPGWVRSACLCYGSHVSTTLVPIYATLFENPNATLAQKLANSVIYAPYFIFPAWLVVLAARDALQHEYDKPKTS